MKRTRQAHGLALLMIVGLFPFGLLSPCAAPKPLYVHAYSPEDISAEFAREQKQKEYDRVEHIARKLFLPTVAEGTWLRPRRVARLISA